MGSSESESEHKLRKKKVKRMNTNGLITVFLTIVTQAQSSLDPTSNVEFVSSRNLMPMSCVTMPQMSSCKNYVYPNTTSDLQMICSMQSSEPGCDLLSKCEEDKVTGDYCDSFSILADLCDTRLHTLTNVMGSCDNYRSMCNSEGTQIEACGKYVSNFLTKDEVVGYVRDMCESGMSGMKACSECTSSSSCAHPLLSYSEMCLEMPGMSKCGYLWTMCKDLGVGFEFLCGDSSSDNDDAPYCTGSGTNMMMNGFVWIPRGQNPCLILFFESWLIDSDLKLALSVIGVFILGISNAFANQYRDYIWKLRSKRKEEILSCAIHTTLGAVQLSIGYFLMLVAMTYVFVYFAAAVVGLAVGQVLVASKSSTMTLNAAQKDSCCGSMSLRAPSMGRDELKTYVPIQENDDDDDVEEGGCIEETKLEIEGMTCSSCIQTVRRALSGVFGVRSVSVVLGAPKSLATVRRVVRDQKNDDGAALLIQAVEDVGFGARLKV